MSSAAVMSASASSSSADSSNSSANLLATLTRRFKANSAQARSLFLGNYAATAAVPLDERSASTKLRVKIASEYAAIEPLVAAGSAAAANNNPSTSNVGRSSTALQRPAQRVVEEATGVLRTVQVEEEEENAANRPRDTEELLQRLPSSSSSSSSAAAASSAASSSSSAVVAYAGGSSALVPAAGLTARQMLIQSKREIEDVRPEWHAPWKLQRVISHAHTGWVRAIAVDHSNEWFVTGSADRTIKIFDLASGNLKLTLTGHISGVRGLAVSKYTPYMFSIGEDKQLFCWDMEVNKTIRSYHGHLSGGYCVSLLEDQAGVNILVSGGRDSVARVWDVRTAAEVAVLTGHTQTVASLQTQMSLPQVITGSHDTTIKLWDLRKTSAPLSTLTHHKKSVRALQLHHTEYTFTSGAGDNLKVWKCPEGTFLRNISGHNATINALALNRENVLVSGADNGSIRFWDYKSGHCFQQYQTIPQPGSLDAESGIFAMAFDMTGSRLFTAETDKSIKVFKEDDNATQETHPLDWKPGNKRRRL